MWHCSLIKYGIEDDRGATLLSPHVVELPLAWRYEGKGRGILPAELVDS